MQVYFFFAKARLMLQLTYRMEALGGFFSSLIPLLTLVFLWRTAFRDGQSVAGVSQDQMTLYSILAVAIKDIFFFQTQDKLLTAVQQGDIATDLIRPYHVLGRLLAEDIALAIGSLLKRFAPLVIFSFLFFALPISVTPSRTLLFVGSAAFSYCILWCLSAIVGMTALWTLDFGNLGMVKDAIVRIFSGSIVPLWFFPDSVQAISAYLPFQYTFQTPIGIAVGKTSSWESLHQIGIQGIWTAVLLMCVAGLWAAGKQKLTVQGG